MKTKLHKNSTEMIDSEREREREKDAQTGRHTQRQTHRETERKGRQIVTDRDGWGLRKREKERIHQGVIIKRES